MVVLIIFIYVELLGKKSVYLRKAAIFRTLLSFSRKERLVLSLNFRVNKVVLKIKKCTNNF